MEYKIAKELLLVAIEKCLHKQIMDKSNKTIHYIFHVEMLEDPIDDFRVLLFINKEKTEWIHYEDTLR